MTLKQYLDHKNQISTFKAEQSNVGGLITFSNSGKRGDVKSFSLGLDSFLSILQDIKANIHRFSAIKDYDETPWRNLGSKLYSNGPANAMSTVQTKPLFATISKIISWANYPSLEHINTDKYCPIENEYIENAITEICRIIKIFTIDEDKKSTNELLESKTIREFVFTVFKMLIKEFGTEFLQMKHAIAERKHGETKYSAFILPDYFNSKNILGSFEKEQNEDSLKTSSTPRFFNENLNILDQKYIYFSTQWGFPNHQYSSDFISFNNFVVDYSEKKYRIIYDEKSGFYKLVFKYIEKKIEQKKFSLNKFQIDIAITGIALNNKVITCFTSSLITKPFVILTGLSGSGKTKLAQTFAMWLCGSEEQYKLVPVGADWTNREPLLGFPNALQDMAYISPESGVLQLILSAHSNPEKPYFLILDEMNLSHVERYFADFLSTMESGEKMLLHTGDEDWDGIPPTIRLPKNLFIVGTVNIDETTYMFSPKVLDRANVIEFRVTAEEMTTFLNQSGKVDLKAIKGQGASMEQSFVALAQDKELSYSVKEEMNTALVGFFNQLKVAGAEYGYRTASEIRRFAAVAEATETNWTTKEILDVVIMQKLLPKLHGSRRKLEPVLKTLIKLCLKEAAKYEDYLQPKADADTSNVLYPLALEKLQRMYRGLIDNGFTSYAEA